MSNEALVRKFYDGFSRLDATAMTECYADTIVFSDPVFPELRGNNVSQMWKMLCSRAKGMRIEYRIEEVDAQSAVVHWEANYLFSKTQRPVLNRVRSYLTIANGKITEHRDDFSFWRWSAQALGPIGYLLGWTPYLKNKVRKQIAHGLAQWVAAN